MACSNKDAPAFGWDIKLTDTHWELLMKPLLPILAALTLAAGCTSTNEIIIDEKGINMSRYEDDLADCRAYSEQVAVGEKAAKGAAMEATVGVGNRCDAAETARDATGVDGKADDAKDAITPKPGKKIKN